MLAAGIELCPNENSGFTLIVNALVAEAPAKSSILAVNENFCPIAVGVPLTAPAEDRDTPGGKLPVKTDHVNGAEPPVATSVCVNAVPYVVAVSAAEVEMVMAALTVIVSLALVAVTGLPALSVADHVKVFTPAEPLTVPVIAPVEVLREVPVGSAPETSA